MKTSYMSPSHFNEVLSIENDCFEFPWHQEDFLMMLGRKRIIANVILDGNDKVVGYYLVKNRRDHVEILNFAIRKDKQRQGYGTLLMEALMKKKPLKLYVSEANLAAHLFLKSCGFKATMVERRYYKEEGLDAYLFECS